MDISYILTWSYVGSFTFYTSLFRVSILVIRLRVFFWAKYYISSPFYLRVFFRIFFLFVVSMLTLVFRESLLWVFLGWEGLGITSFVLVIFYQNWLSTNGGLLTLLTNRLGDGVLLLVATYLIINGSLHKTISVTLCLLFILLAFTKRAQWPFVRWLPAAIAAPTPVRALVHRSTLVTAGIWIMLRFSLETTLRYKLWLTIGLMTLTTARLRALLETDGKKMVALSTLRQLGLINIALAISRKFLCLFHILRHAFAKANLFMIVGSLIHLHYSNQDSRKIRFSNRPFLLLSFLLRVISLVGLVYSSGFYSKDRILIRHHSVINRILRVLIISSIVLLTFLYCFKLLVSLMKSPAVLVSALTRRINMEATSTFLAGLRIVFGHLFLINLQINYLIVDSLLNLIFILMIMSFTLASVFTIYLRIGIKLASSIILNTTTLNSLRKKTGEIMSGTLESWYLHRLHFNWASSSLKYTNVLLIIVILLGTILLVKSPVDARLWF